MTLTNGLVVMTPSSVATTGASSTATINADGSVTFGLCETLSLNGVFTGDYDNYMMTARYNGSASISLRGQLRAGGANNSTASSYVSQFIYASSTSVTGNRATSSHWQYFGEAQTTAKDGTTYFLYGPYLSQPTAMRYVQVTGTSSATLFDAAGTHNQSTSYDGVSFICSSGTFSGLITVFGFNQ
jgi:hypothetical protein